VAGGVEYGDLDSIGIDGRAALEVKEEAGFEVETEDMINLGEGTFSAPGFGMEKLHYRAVRVNPDKGSEPEGDGHPLEEVGDFQFHELSEAISWCRSGEIYGVTSCRQSCVNAHVRLDLIPPLLTEASSKDERNG
jgi:8-oxo-dGTP pyrophosphatase MutT (NUDIX family)